uniref:UNC93-like protein 3 n=1 Tax=Araucaria cunninghamii TaxID=56994 RepID=A0A0D6R3Q3_ARACU
MTMEAGNENVSLLSESSSIDGNAPELQRLNFRSKTSSRHLRDLHILSFTFLFVFLAYAAAQNLESSVNSEKNLGTTSLGILYLSFTVCSFVATPIVRRLGSKNSLILGTSGYWLFIAANLFPSWYTMVPASLYLGFTASIIWVAEGTYLTFAARGHATECNLPEGAVLGNFNGEFWGMFASTQVIGNLLSLVLLKTGTEGKSTSGTTLLFAVFLGKFTKYVVEPAIGVAGVGGVMAIFGATDAVSSLVAGRLTTGLLSISSITCTGILFQALVLLRLWLSHSFGSSRASLINIVVMAAAWGAGDGVFNTQTNALLAILFPHDTEAAFSQLKIWQSGAISVVFFVSPHIAFTTMLAALAITLFISLVGLSMITFYVGKAVPQRS